MQLCASRYRWFNLSFSLVNVAITEHAFVWKWRLSVLVLNSFCDRCSLVTWRNLEMKNLNKSYVYWTVHHLDSWIKIDQLDVTWFIISPFTAQHVSSVSTSIFRSLRLIVDLFHGLYCSGSMCVGVTLWFGWVVWYPYAGRGTSASAWIRLQYNTWSKSTISRKLLKMDVLTFETFWAVNGEIINQVTSSWSIFIHLSRWCTVQ